MIRVRLHHQHLVLAVAVLAGLLACAQPIAARGTGGFLREWAVCGPLEGTSLESPAVGNDFAAWPGLFALDRVWLPVAAEEDGRVDLRLLWPGPTAGVALLHTFFLVPADGRYVLRIGSDDSARVEIDGRVVYRRDVKRSWRADEDEAAVDLARGWHRMLVRVVEYGGAWAASVRLADARGRPLEIRHQARVPPALEKDYGLSEAASLGERVAAARGLAREADLLVADLDARRERQEEIPPGYATFASYAGARAFGIGFFDAMERLWQARVTGEPDEEAAALAAAEAVEAARGLSDALASETEALVADSAAIETAHERLGGGGLSRGGMADAVLGAALAVRRTRTLADRVEKEYVLMVRLENDIRNWRQGDLGVRVLDAEGGAVEGAQVEIVQTGHAFLFGCNVFALGRWGDARKNRLYEERFLHLFNLATVPAYWSALESRRGRPDYGALDGAMEWAGKHGLAVEGHALLWDETVPTWVADLDAGAARSSAEAHIRRLLERCGERVGWWDLVCPAEGDFRVGAGRVPVADVLRWSAEAAPAGRFVLIPSDLRQVGRLAAAQSEAGVPRAAVGLPAHQHEGIWPADLVQRNLETAASAGLPVRVTAVTILGGSGEEADQAEAVRRFYTAAFAHPKVVSVSWWDLSDRFAWQGAAGGLVRSDLSPKPAYEVLDRLINHLWRTDAAGRSDADGRVGVRAFFGRYRITVRSDRRSASVEVDFRPEGPAEVTVVLPPANNAA